MEQVGQRNDAVLKDAQPFLKREECVRGMEQSVSYAALKDAIINPGEEECVSNTEQRSNNAALKGAQINPNEEEYVRDTVHTASPMMNLLLSPRVLDQNSIRLR